MGKGGRRGWQLLAGALVITLVGLVVALYGKGGSTPNPPPSPTAAAARPAEGVESEEEESHGGREEDQEIRSQREWFYLPRAYPYKDIPAGALLHARGQAHRLGRMSRGQPTAALAAPTAPLAFSSFGPRPISQSSAPAVWNGPPPYAGRVTAMAHDPTNAAVAYLGAANGGVWKTSDSGTHWSPIFDYRPSLAIGALAIDPQAHLTPYVGTGEPNDGRPVGQGGTTYFGAGLFRSTDGGASFSKIGGALFNTCYVSAIAVKPGASNTILVGVINRGTYTTACQNGIYRSTDGGLNFTRVITGSPSAIAFKPGVPTTVYAGFWEFGVWKSTQSGASGSWVRLGGGLPTTSISRVALAVTPASSGRIYAAFSTPDGNARGIWTSTDSGTSWNALPFRNFCVYPGSSDGKQCTYDLALAAYPDNGNYVYAAGIHLVRYDGSQWTTLGYNQSNGVHVDIHSLTFDSGGRLWVGSDGGAYLKAGGQTGFTNLNATLGITQMYPGTTGTSNGLFLAGTQDNGTIARSSGVWNQFSGGDGGYTAYDGLDQLKISEYIGATVSRTTAANAQECVFTTLADFATDCLRYAGDPALFVAPLIRSPSSQQTLFVGTNRIWKTTNVGTSWTTISPQYAGKVSALAQSKSSASVIYGAWTGDATTTPFVGYTTDGGAHWLGTAALPNRFITDLAVKQTAPGVAWVTLSGYNTGHVYVTQNYGGTWTNISGNLPNAPVNKIAVDSRTSPSTLYVGTDVGVFWSTDGGASWANTSRGLPNTVVMDVHVDATSNTIIASTYGRGAFSAPLP